jgi:ATP-dependent phosphofructokinase / diphosphate-dependent phosphofructokinase
MKKRIGILNSGGDCAGLNTVIDAVVKSLSKDDEYEIIGFLRGYEGLLEGNYVQLDKAYTSQYRWIGGTILKSTNKGNFPCKRDNEEFDSQELEVIERAYKNYTDLGLEGLVVLGGDGTLYTAYRLQKFGFNIIGVPKSIDNDLNATTFTFGFHTAVQLANNAIDSLHTTANSHDRIMILEVMGRDAGWIALYSGIAGGANIILIPEIPFDYNKITEFLDYRYNTLNKSSIIVVSEAAKSLNEEATFSGVNSEGKVIYGGIGQKLAHYINANTNYEARSTSLGHIQRGGSPIAFDKVISTQLGAFASRMVKQNNWGTMVVYNDNGITQVSLDKGVLELKLVEPNSQLVQIAKEIGICFGD